MRKRGFCDQADWLGNGKDFVSLLTRAEPLMCAVLDWSANCRNRCYLLGYLVPYWSCFRNKYISGGEISVCGNVPIRHRRTRELWLQQLTMCCMPCLLRQCEQRVFVAFRWREQETANESNLYLRISRTLVHGRPWENNEVRVKWVKELGFYILVLDLAYWPKSLECD